MINVTNFSEHILVLENFWSPSICLEMISKSERMGYEAAKVETEKGQEVIENIRNNKRILFSDTLLAEELWQNIKPYAPKRIGNSSATGLNELFRYYRYNPGEKFKKHSDQSYIRNNEEASYYTLILYLNDDFTGGETTFRRLTIKPKQGMALIFLHDLEHTGEEVISGTKYVLRTDIMYKLDLDMH